MSHGWKEDSMLVKLLAAYTHLHVFSFPFLRYSKLLVENCDIFIPHLCLAPPAGGDPVVISWLLMLVKLEWFGYRMVKKYDDMLSRFHIQYQRVTDGHTEWKTELLYQYRVSVCWRAIKTSLGFRLGRTDGGRTVCRFTRLLVLRCGTYVYHSY